jgi:hypothetical protein
MPNDDGLRFLGKESVDEFKDWSAKLGTRWKVWSRAKVAEIVLSINRVTRVLWVLEYIPLGGSSYPLYGGLGLRVHLEVYYIMYVGLPDMGLTFLFT